MPDSKPMRWSSFRSAAESSPTDRGSALPRPPASAGTTHQSPNIPDTPLDQSPAKLPAQNQLSWPPGAPPFSFFSRTFSADAKLRNSASDVLSKFIDIHGLKFPWFSHFF